jgi:hypothetical protein
MESVRGERKYSHLSSFQPRNVASSPTLSSNYRTFVSYCEKRYCTICNSAFAAAASLAYTAPFVGAVVRKILMRRGVEWTSQARQVVEYELDPDYLDPKRPTLAQVKSAAFVIAELLARSRVFDSVPAYLNDAGNVKVWVYFEGEVIVAFGIQASYDGGRTWDNPLSWYPAIGSEPEPGMR